MRTKYVIIQMFIILNILILIWILLRFYIILFNKNFKLIKNIFKGYKSYNNIIFKGYKLFSINKNM